MFLAREADLIAQLVPHIVLACEMIPDGAQGYGQDVVPGRAIPRRVRPRLARRVFMFTKDSQIYEDGGNDVSQ